MAARDPAAPPGRLAPAPPGEGIRPARSLLAVTAMTLDWTAPGRALLDLLAPDRCARCEAEARGAPPGWCGPCWDDLPWMPPDRCGACGTPWSGSACPRCAAQGRPWVRLVCATEHRGPIRRLVPAWKYGSRPDLGRPLAALLRQALAGLPEDLDVDVVVPVPQPAEAWSRRGFSPALALARDAARRAHRPVSDALARRRRAPPQVGLTAAERRRNVRRLFAPNRGALRCLRGRRVLLVDDVVTTGATVEACGRALMAGGAAVVVVAALARALP